MATVLDSAMLKIDEVLYWELYVMITYHPHTNEIDYIIPILQRKQACPADYVEGPGLEPPGQLNPEPATLCDQADVSLHHRRAWSQG